MSPEHERRMTGVLPVSSPPLSPRHSTASLGGLEGGVLNSKRAALPCLRSPAQKGEVGAMGLCATLENNSPSPAGKREEGSKQAWCHSALSCTHGPGSRLGQVRPYPCGQTREAREAGNCGLALKPAL